MSSNSRPDLYGPIFLVKDIAASVRFYFKTLALKGEASGPWAEVQAKSGRLVLLDRRFWAKATGLKPSRPRAARDEPVVLTVQLADVDRAHQRLSRAGVLFLGPPKDVPMMGVRIAFLRDPDGHLVELSTGMT